MHQDKTPKKKRLKKKTESFDPKANADIKELTQKALRDVFDEQLKNKTDRKKNLDALAATIEEFLTSYIVIGYTIEGNAINIVSAHNQLEADSLTTLMNRFFNNHIGHRSNDNEE